MTDDPATGRGDQDNWRSRLREFGATWQVMLAEAAGKIPDLANSSEANCAALVRTLSTPAWLWDERKLSEPTSGWR